MSIEDAQNLGEMLLRNPRMYELARINLQSGLMLEGGDERLVRRSDGKYDVQSYAQRHGDEGVLRALGRAIFDEVRQIEQDFFVENRRQAQEWSRQYGYSEEAYYRTGVIGWGLIQTVVFIVLGYFVYSKLNAF